jgi:hypothetical protein
MLSTLNLTRTDPQDHDHDGVVITPAVEEPSSLAPDTTRAAQDVPVRTAPDFSPERPVPPIDATFRPADTAQVQTERQIERPLERPIEPPVERQFAGQAESEAAIRIPDDRPWPGRLMRRTFVGLLMALVGAAATLTWQSDGGEAKRIVARWVSRIPLASWPPVKKQAIAEPSSQPSIQAAEATAQAPQPTAPQPAAQQPASQQPQPQQQASPQPAQQLVSNPPVPPQPAPSAQAAPEAVAPVAAIVPPELTQSLQAMARDLATLQQGMERLKANQEQMARDIAKLAEQDTRRKVSAPLPRVTSPPLPPFPPARAATRRPAPIYPPQATVQPYPAPLPPAVPPPAVAPAAQPQLSSVPRPPAAVP